MSKQITISRVLKTSGGSYTITQESVNCDADVEFEIEVPAGATVECDIAIPVAKMKAWGMHLQKSPNATAVSNLNATIKTNSTGSPGNTFTLSGTNGVGWSAGEPIANPITVDLTKIYIINPDTQPIMYRHAFGYNESPQSV